MVRLYPCVPNDKLTNADIYVAVVGGGHNVAPKGYYIAIVSTIAEKDANHHEELKHGIVRLGGKLLEQFMGSPIPLYEPIESGKNDNIFISKSYDATSHFETTTGKPSCGNQQTYLLSSFR
jgi:Rab GDP dissociation inhibitor